MDTTGIDAGVWVDPAGWLVEHRRELDGGDANHALVFHRPDGTTITQSRLNQSAAVDGVFRL